jgi:glycosyltransferase involved in cell wall biosynthesis
VIKKNTKVVITGAFRFPEGDAAAARVLGIGKSLRSFGCDVSFAGWETSERPEDYVRDGLYVYEKFKYASQNEFRTERLSPLKRLVRYFSAGGNTIKWLAAEKLPKNSVVISYHGNSIFLIRLMIFCWVNKLKLIADCTEWYDADGLVGGRFGFAHLDSEFRMRVLNPRIKNIIVISEFLRKYYLLKNCNVVLIPPTVDLANKKWGVVDRRAGEGFTDGLRLVYAGVPGKKDVLYSVIIAIKVLKDRGVNISLDLIGPSRSDILRCVDGDEYLLNCVEDCLNIRGRVNQSMVPGLLKESDFSVLLRPRRRSSDAGFSTKLVESLASGVPVIVNITGDIGNYIKDGVEGFVVEDCSADSFLVGMEKILNLHKDQFKKMRVSAKTRAEHSFSYDRYAECLSKYFDVIVKS